MTANQKYLIAGIVVVIGGVIIYSINNSSTAKPIVLSNLINQPKPLLQTEERLAINRGIDWISGWDNGVAVDNDWHKGIFDYNKSAFMHGSRYWNWNDTAFSNPTGLTFPPKNPYDRNMKMGPTFQRHVMEQAKLYSPFKNSTLTIEDFDWTYFMKTWNNQNPYIKQNHGEKP